MEYLIIAGSDLRASLADSLGDYAPFFWNVIAPVGLFILWAGSIYVLWETWFSRGSEGEGGGGGLVKLLFTACMLGVILATGTALEFLVLGGGHFHAWLLGGVVDMVSQN